MNMETRRGTEGRRDPFSLPNTMYTQGTKHLTPDTPTQPLHPDAPTHRHSPHTDTRAHTHP
ncbi:hypothetical protein E2C01_036475 [Portunus trituberculatus]|uniref:Uncharacterized protein n=1 Tax=Portunus trituberculatus TaxID=210409 RepID=A0A5B7FCK1_PORTR|nr:hypothetical protein [Portunus trituberculatus]